ncbi:hypothetical protein M0804_015371 [Polistes exclamans]|nr:hypothetical protein M0804_015372 [Polistes exclamans]KAI4473382.1 hypothetical protein M0804_015371 [Polistes exclamans]
MVMAMVVMMRVLWYSCSLQVVFSLAILRLNHDRQLLVDGFWLNLQRTRQLGEIENHLKHHHHHHHHHLLTIQPTHDTQCSPTTTTTTTTTTTITHFANPQESVASKNVPLLLLLLLQLYTATVAAIAAAFTPFASMELPKGI